jgi:hypothetical protein
MSRKNYMSLFCENIFLFRYTLLLSEISRRQIDTPPSSQSLRLFSSHGKLMQIKRRQMHR